VAGLEAGADAVSVSDALAAPADEGVADQRATPADGSPPPHSRIQHVVVIVQENHTFDAYFGHYCTAPAGSSPTCNDGPACCEAAPAHDPAGNAPVTLDDSENGARDPAHYQSCELAEIDGGAMDRFTTGASCSNPHNFAVAPPSAVATYLGWAANYAIADRYFQPIAGASSSNDMYLAMARYVFTDNDEYPNAIGRSCVDSGANTTTYKGQNTLADLLVAQGDTFAFYAQGYAAMRAAQGSCPPIPADCPARTSGYPCAYDPSDDPFAYYSQWVDDPAYMKDSLDLSADVAAGRLPSVSFVKGLGYQDEHPGGGTTLTAGQSFAAGIVNTIEGSPYASSTLILITWDEGGGFFDHVPPPAKSSVDGQPYGTRVPLLAIGPFVRANFVSHVTLEHSSIVKLIELNFLGSSGQLGGRDATVANLGSLLDPTATGITIPSS
jgi:phospholipase C